ncbi:hypothetical protein E4A41_07255, partial [Micrococcus endophyticus]
ASAVRCSSRTPACADCASAYACALTAESSSMYAQMDSPSSMTTDMSMPSRAHSAERSRNTIRAEVR